MTGPQNPGPQNPGPQYTGQQYTGQQYAGPQHTDPQRTSDPDQLRRDIERTQAALSQDVNALGEKVSPGRIVGRRVDRVRGSASRLKDRVMGNDSPGYPNTDPDPSCGAAGAHRRWAVPDERRLRSRRRRC